MIETTGQGKKPTAREWQEVAVVTCHTAKLHSHMSHACDVSATRVRHAPRAYAADTVVRLGSGTELLGMGIETKSVQALDDWALMGSPPNKKNSQ